MTSTSSCSNRVHWLVLVLAILGLGIPARANAGIVKTFAVCSDAAMSQPSTRPPLYKGYRFPPEIIGRCVWLYYRFGVSLRDVSELMLARGIEVSHEAIRLWTLRFGTDDVRRRRRRRGPCSNIWHLDELGLISTGSAAGCGGPLMTRAKRFFGKLL